MTDTEDLTIFTAGFIKLCGRFDGFSEAMLLHRHVTLWERARRSSSYAHSKETSGDSVRGGKTVLMKWNISQMSIHYYWERRWHRWLRVITHHQARGKQQPF